MDVRGRDTSIVTEASLEVVESIVRGSPALDG